MSTLSNQDIKTMWRKHIEELHEINKSLKRMADYYEYCIMPYNDLVKLREDRAKEHKNDETGVD